ncbi:MAG: DMT family transporter [Alphaproteobacteria bacterium]
MTEKNKFLFVPILAVVGVIYSALFPVNQMSIENGLPYIGYVFWFNLLATLMLFVVSIYKGELPRLTWPYIRAYLLIGTVAVAIPVPLFTFLADKLPIGIITLLLVLVPLLTYVISYVLRIEKFRLSGVMGLLLGLCGLLFVLIPKTGLPAPEMVGWTLLALIGPLCFALSNAFAAYLRPPGAPSLMMAAGVSAGATILLAPMMLASSHAFVFPTATLDSNLPILFAAAITGLEIIAWFTIVRITGPVFFSQYTYFIVLGGFGWGYLLHDEYHSFYVWIATALAFAGLAIFTRGAKSNGLREQTPTAVAQ